ncbi:hypothetical protein RJ640_026717 [Escallonia rubra]|uniref:ATP-dependent DNA helicase n=1 Tax=Escallonia rubra TaxID=112253 RepID=A0AA88QNH9_9ASTE|nr:hypothetical protein RJ640_026717 [Escallonia rubra]
MPSGSSNFPNACSFATTFCNTPYESNIPRALWDTFYDSLSEDFRHNQNLKDVKIIHRMIKSVEYFLESMGRNISEYNLPSSVDVKELDFGTKYKEIEEELCIEIPHEDLMYVSQLNTCQRTAYNTIWQHVQTQAASAFFVDGLGGTGKTYIYRALLATTRSKGLIVLATATSGIAASNLPGWSYFSFTL